MSKYLTKLYQEVAKLRARIAELEARLLSFECGYCGEVLATPEEGQAHIRKCEKHPLHYATKHIAELEVEVEQWRAEKQDAENPSIRSMTRAEHLLMDNIGRVGALEADLSDRQTEIERLTNEVRILKARDEYALSELAMMECLHTEAGEPVFADRARAIRQTLMGAKDDIVLEEETDDECWRLESGSYFARGITSTVGDCCVYIYEVAKMNGSKRGKGKPVYRTQKVLRGELAVGKWIVFCPWDHIYSERILEKSAMIEAAYVGFWPYDCFAFSLSNGQPNKKKLVRIERVEKGENKVTIIAREELTEEERGCFNRWVARKEKMIYDVVDDC